MAGSQSSRPLRADAARNVEKIITAARTCLHEEGRKVSLQRIAQLAGVSQATLYRNFADRDALVYAVLGRQLRIRLDPVMLNSLNASDAFEGMRRLLTALTQVAAEEIMVLDGLVGRRGLYGTLGVEIVAALRILLLRAQAQGRIREDVSTTDIVRIATMLIASVDTIDPGTAGWHRPVALIMDSLRISAQQEELPRQTPLPPMQALGS